MRIGCKRVVKLNNFTYNSNLNIKLLPETTENKTW